MKKFNEVFANCSASNSFNGCILFRKCIQLNWTEEKDYKSPNVADALLLFLDHILGENILKDLRRAEPTLL